MTRDDETSPRKASQMLKVSLHFVYQLLWAGQLAGSRKVGKNWKIPLSAIKARLNRSQQ
jgi:hypothetical protein